MAEKEQLFPVTSPVSEDLYPALATVLLVGGLCMTGSFFLYEVTRTQRDLRQEILLAFIAASLLGLGTLFLLLWTGVYV